MSVSTSLLFQSPLRTSFSSWRCFKTFSTIVCSSFFDLSSRDCPPRPVIFFNPSRCFSTNSMSLIRISSEIIPKSRHGSTSPKTLVTIETETPTRRKGTTKRGQLGGKGVFGMNDTLHMNNLCIVKSPDNLEYGINSPNMT